MFDARDLTTRKINLELRWLLYEQGVRDVTVLNPGALHSLGVGILTRCRITFEGSLGYFGCGLIDGPEVHIKGRVGWSACENMMSGVVVDRRQRRLADRRGAARRRRGRQGPRRGAHGHRPEGRHDHRRRRRRLDDRLHDAARPPDPLGDVGPGLGDSMYDGTIYVGGQRQVARRRLRARRVDRRGHRVRSSASSASTGSARRPSSQKFVCGKKLYNYDTLEPSERKLVL